MSIIEVHNLRKAYGETRAVADVSFSVEEGEIFGILGPNGAGKTTTVECLQGLRTRDAGTVRILDMDPDREPDDLRRVIGSQLQAAALPERIRVREALNLFAAFAPEAADVDELLRDWGLWEKRGSAFDSLSGGQRQRLFVALALVNRPRIVFLDELTTGLDPAARRSAWQLIRSVRDGGATVVLVTHFMDEAQTLCDRLAIIDDGRVVACGAPAALVAAHSSGNIAFTIPVDHRDRDFGFLASLPGVEAVERDGSSITVSGAGALLQHVAAALLGAGIEVPDLAAEPAGLEDVFLRLTGRDMRED